MFSGELVNVVKTGETNEDEVGLMMAGITGKEAGR